MTDKDDGGPAFPVIASICRDSNGMSLRDHFAGLALQGLLANSDALNGLYSTFAEAAYKYADAMLRERKS